MKNKLWLIIIPSLLAGYNVFSQETAASDTTSPAPEEKPVPELILNMRYFQPVNKIPYLQVIAKTKLERKLTPEKDLTGNVYINDTSATSVLGKIKTDEKGESRIFIPATIKPLWDSSTTFTFIAITDSHNEFESKTTELQVTKARLAIDTSSEGETRNITVAVTELKNGEWVPAKDVELKITVKRLLGNLPVGEEETYTTDSTGTAVAAFTRDSLQGDSNGSLILEIRTEDNEFYGNLFAEIKVPWGISPKADTTYNKRSLWGNKFKTPIWLLTAANAIILGVWAVLIYLIILFFKIRNSGKPGRKNTYSKPAISYKE